MPKEFVFINEIKDLWCPCCGERLFDNGEKMNEETHTMLVNKEGIAFICNRSKLVEISVRIKDA